MSQNVQDLINKIREEGLQASEQKAREIEDEVKKKADTIIAQTRQQAEKIIAEAKAQQKQLEDSTRASLQQAARDTVLTLHQTINDMLKKILERQVREALGKDQMAALITELAKQFMGQDKVDIGLTDEARTLLQEDVLAKLQKQIKGSVQLHTADDLTGGLTISFDEGKSKFDFSDQALVEFLGKYVNEYVGALLKDSKK